MVSLNIPFTVTLWDNYPTANTFFCLSKHFQNELQKLKQNKSVMLNKLGDITIGLHKVKTLKDSKNINFTLGWGVFINTKGKTMKWKQTQVPVHIYFFFLSMTTISWQLLLHDCHLAVKYMFIFVWHRDIRASRMWVHDMICRRQKYGEYHHL